MSAKIIPFPIDRNVLQVREAARILGQRHGQAAERFWQMTCRRLYARLLLEGISPEDIKIEIARFTSAVHAQLRRSASEAANVSNPKGAA